MKGEVVSVLKKGEMGKVRIELQPFSSTQKVCQLLVREVATSVHAFSCSI